MQVPKEVKQASKNPVWGGDEHPNRMEVRRKATIIEHLLSPRHMNG